MKQVVVVGSGASGLVAAIYIAKKNHKVTVLERYDSCAKKILVTGNGRCNYWNSDQRNIHYHATENEWIEKVNTEENRKEILKFFDQLGIVPKVINGYYYPYSKTATAIKSALLLECKRLQIEIETNCTVERIIQEKEKFMMLTRKKNILADAVVLATGSLAYYKEKENIGYQIASSFGHRIVDVLPSLVQLKARGTYQKDWNGIRSDARISVFHKEKLLKEEEGEILLTDYGVSGICVFNISRYVSILLHQKEKVTVKVNFVPWYTGNDFLSWLEERNHLVKGRNIDELLEGFLNYKLVHVLLNICKIKKEKGWNGLTKEEKEHLRDAIEGLEVEVEGTNSFDKAQVCTGGVDVTEIDPLTMESKIVKNLYIVGELLDVDGDCGGYNLSFAWMSGMLAGKSIGEHHD